MMLASLSFYQCVLITIFPWLMEFSECLKTNNLERKYSETAKFLRGNNSLPTAEMSVCKNFVNLIEDVIKWMGIYIDDHPYTKIKFRSAFRMLLDRMPSVQASKVNNLNFFKPEDSNRYRAYYLEKESGEGQGQKIEDFLHQVLSRVDESSNDELLSKLLETGDGNVIAFLVEELDAELQEIGPSQTAKGAKTVRIINQLMQVGEIQFCNRVKLQILPKIVTFIQMLHHHKIEESDTSGPLKIISMLADWKTISQQSGLPVGCYETAFTVLKTEGIIKVAPSFKNKPYHSFLRLTPEINKEKLSELKLSESQAMLKIGMCKYIPLEEPSGSRHSQNVVRAVIQEENSLSSNKSSAKKIQYLETYSKIPSGKQINPSEVKQIHFQHSNLSDQFVQHHPKPEVSAKPLLISFKKNEDSPEVVFSDSFNSNQKNSPQKLSPVKYLGLDNKYIDIIEEPSISMANSEKSEPVKEKPENLAFNSSYSKQKSDNIQLHQQSNKQASKVSEVSDYYPEEAKYSANFKKQSSSSNKKSIIDNYIPSDNNEKESMKKSKESIKPKEEKSSSIRNTRGKALVRSSSKQIVVHSPKSKISHSRSIKLIQFNEAEGHKEQGYSLPSPSNPNRFSVQAIKVEKTLIKPKFGFKCTEESVETQQVESLEVPPEEIRASLSKTDSISVNISAESEKVGQVPENFGDLLGMKKDPVRVNNYDFKIRELEMKISRMKEKKMKIQEQVMTQDQQIMMIKKEMPTPLKELQEQNKKLLRGFQKSKQTPLNRVPNQNGRQFKGEFVHLSVVPMDEGLKKKILYLKCRLLQNEELDIGLQIKSRQMTLYFTFKKAVDQLSVKMEPNSLKLNEPLDTTIYNVLEGKQIKFKSKIIDYTLFDNSFELAKLKIQLKNDNKAAKTHHIQIPYHLYNELTFHPPRQTITYTKSTDWHFCCPSLLSDHQYLTDFLPNGRYSSGGYETKIQLQGYFFNSVVVVEGEKFKIEFQSGEKVLQVVILKCLLSFLQRQHNKESE